MKRNSYTVYIRQITFKNKKILPDKICSLPHSYALLINSSVHLTCLENQQKRGPQKSEYFSPRSIHYLVLRARGNDENCAGFLFFSLQFSTIRLQLVGREKEAVFQAFKGLHQATEGHLSLYSQSVFKYIYQKYQSLKTLMKLITTMNYYYYI